jgi:hypothetical protein
VFIYGHETCLIVFMDMVIVFVFVFVIDDM